MRERKLVYEIKYSDDRSAYTGSTVLTQNLTQLGRLSMNNLIFQPSHRNACIEIQ